MHTPRPPPQTVNGPELGDVHPRTVLGRSLERCDIGKGSKRCAPVGVFRARHKGSSEAGGDGCDVNGGVPDDEHG